MFDLTSSRIADEVTSRDEVKSTPTPKLSGRGQYPLHAGVMGSILDLVPPRPTSSGRGRFHLVPRSQYLYWDEVEDEDTNDPHKEHS